MKKKLVIMITEDKNEEGKKENCKVVKRMSFGRGQKDRNS